MWQIWPLTVVVRTQACSYILDNCNQSNKSWLRSTHNTCTPKSSHKLCSWGYDDGVSYSFRHLEFLQLHRLHEDFLLFLGRSWVCGDFTASVEKATDPPEPNFHVFNDLLLENPDKSLLIKNFIELTNRLLPL